MFLMLTLLIYTILKLFFSLDEFLVQAISINLYNQSIFLGCGIKMSPQYYYVTNNWNYFQKIITDIINWYCLSF